MSANLKSHIDSIVNSVHAFEGRKIQWREELLAHMADLLKACDGDEAQTLARFGDAGTIRRELQNSVPIWERVAGRQIMPDPPREATRQFWRRPEESAVHYGFRMAAYLWSAQIALFFLGILGGVLWRPENGDHGEYIVRVASVGVPMCFMTFLVLAPLIAFATTGASFLSQVLKGGALSVWLFLVMVGYTVVQNRIGYLLYTEKQHEAMAARALLAPVIFHFLGRLVRREHTQYLRWRDMEPTIS